MARKDDAARAWSVLSGLFLSDEQHDRFHQVCAVLDLPHPGALKLLLHVDPDDPPTMGDVARLLNCDASYVTVLVDALEGPGYAERRGLERDRRVKTVVLTAAGAAAQDRARALLATPPPRMERLDATETRQLADLLTKLAQD